MIKCLYLKKQALKSLPVYSDLFYTTGTDLPSVNFKYKSVTISLPNEFKDGNLDIFSLELSTIFTYDFVKYFFYLKKDNLFVDVIYIDRTVIFDFKYAKRNMVFFKQSGKEMKDITRYNSGNDNHLFVDRGCIIPTFYTGSDGNVLYEFVEDYIYSNSLEGNRSLFILKKELKKLKSVVVIIINKQLVKICHNKTYMSSKDYLKVGFKRLYKYYPLKLQKSNYKTFSNEIVDKKNASIFNHNFCVFQTL